MTGGLGAGKSTALAVLEQLGAEVLSADLVVHELYNSPQVRDAVVEKFGPSVAPQGEIDRTAVAQAAFAAPDGRGWLEELIWPRVGERIASWRQELERAPQPPRAGVVEVPLLFESGMQDGFDVTIAIIAGEELREARAGARGHHGLQERNSRQLSQEEKARRATYTVVNDGTVEDLEAELSSILGKLNHP